MSLAHVLLDGGVMYKTVTCNS